MDLPDFSALAGDQLLPALQEFCTKAGVSDIHVSPEKNTVRLEIRLHGMLEELKPMTRETYEQLVRKVKFDSSLKLNVTNIPQDGQYTFNVEDRVVNVRVATLPTTAANRDVLAHLAIGRKLANRRPKNLRPSAPPC